MTKKSSSAAALPALPSVGGSTVFSKDGRVISRAQTILPDPIQPVLETASMSSQTPVEPASKES